MELEKEFVDLKAVTALTELYTAGIEYYASINKTDRATVFQNKLKQMMIKPNVLAAMERKTKGEDSHEVELKMAEYNKQRKLQELQMKVAQSSPGEYDARLLVKMTDLHVEEVMKIIDKDVSMQKENLKKRLEQRKNLALSRSTSLPPPTRIQAEEDEEDGDGHAKGHVDNGEEHKYNEESKKDKKKFKMDRWEIRDVIAEEDDDIPDGCMTPNRKVSSASKSEIAKAKRNSRVDIPELGLDSGRINRRTSLKRYENFEKEIAQRRRSSTAKSQTKSEDSFDRKTSFDNGKSTNSARADHGEGTPTNLSSVSSTLEMKFSLEDNLGFQAAIDGLNSVANEGADGKISVEKILDTATIKSETLEIKIEVDKKKEEGFKPELDNKVAMQIIVKEQEDKKVESDTNNDSSSDSESDNEESKAGHTKNLKQQIDGGDQQEPVFLSITEGEVKVELDSELAENKGKLINSEKQVQALVDDLVQISQLVIEKEVVQINEIGELSNQIESIQTNEEDKLVEAKEMLQEKETAQNNEYEDTQPVLEVIKVEETAQKELKSNQDEGISLDIVPPEDSILSKNDGLAQTNELLQTEETKKIFADSLDAESVEKGESILNNLIPQDNQPLEAIEITEHRKEISNEAKQLPIETLDSTIENLKEIQSEVILPKAEDIQSVTIIQQEVKELQLPTTTQSEVQEIQAQIITKAEVQEIQPEQGEVKEVQSEAITQPEETKIQLEATIREDANEIQSEAITKIEVKEVQYETVVQQGVKEILAETVIQPEVKEIQTEIITETEIKVIQSETNEIQPEETIQPQITETQPETVTKSPVKEAESEIVIQPQDVNPELNVNPLEESKEDNNNIIQEQPPGSSFDQEFELKLNEFTSELESKRALKEAQIIQKYQDHLAETSARLGTTNPLFKKLKEKYTKEQTEELRKLNEEYNITREKEIESFKQQYQSSKIK